MATDIIQQAQELRADAEARVKVLRSELEELEAFLAGTSGSKSTPRRRASSKGVNRADEFVALVGQNPEGITVAQAAKQMDEMGPNYLYRVAGRMASEGKVRKDGPTFFPVKDKAEAPATDTNESEAVPTF